MHDILRILAMAAAMLVTIIAPASAAQLTLSGDVTYRERIALPPGATLSVGLVDLASPDEPRVAAEAAIATPGQVPLTFSLNFDEEVLVEGHDYALVARITGEDGALWFTNTEPYLIDPRAPVTPILIVVNFAGRLEPPALPAATPILDITWRADSIGGQPVASGVNSTLSISGDMRAGGRGGCNSWFAQAEINGEVLAFSAVAATRMACAEDAANAQETSFFAALGATRFWRLLDEKLLLVDATGLTLAEFSRSRF